MKIRSVCLLFFICIWSFLEKAKTYHKSYHRFSKLFRVIERRRESYALFGISPWSNDVNEPIKRWIFLNERLSSTVFQSKSTTLSGMVSDIWDLLVFQTANLRSPEMALDSYCRVVFPSY